MPQKKSPRGKIARRLGINVFGNPKYDRILKKKPNSPGKSPKYRSRGRKSDYGIQLLEKQKIRYTYGLSERQFRNTFYKARKKAGLTSEIFIQMLESRLDNVVYRLGWAVSREQARQMVSHGHFKVNSVKSDIPSMMLKPGDMLTVKKSEKSRSMIKKRISGSGTVQAPWLNADSDSLTAVVDALPAPAAVQPAGDLQAVIEYYS